MNDLVANSIERLTKSAKDKNISIENTTGKDEIRVEENLIIQAIINLIHNAIKYSNEGS